MQDSGGLSGGWPLTGALEHTLLIFPLFLLHADGVHVCVCVAGVGGGFPINPSLPLISFHLENEPGWPWFEMVLSSWGQDKPMG